MDLLIIAFLAIVTGIILTAMGLSFLNQSLKPLDYIGDQGWGLDSADYYQNPLYRFKSKYFHYRPAGWVVLSEEQWENIEENVGATINKAMGVGEKIGYRKAITEIQNKVDEERRNATPASPYAVLDVESATPKVQVMDKYQTLMIKYSPKNFADLDEAFVELAKIRQEQFTKAWKKLSHGTGKI